MEPVRVAIAGSSGSIGTQALDVVRAEGPDRYRVVALGVATAVDVLIDQAREFRPDMVAVADPAARDAVAAAVSGLGIEVVADMTTLVDPADVVINGVVGFAGLPVTTETLRAGRRLGLANKESLIAAGPIVQPLRATPGAELVPVDSEHCAIHQCLRSSVAFRDAHPAVHDEVRRLVLTASGGPFRGRTRAELAQVTPEQALAHPTWSMGPLVTTNSATLVNKGLEVIEAHLLFGVPFESIDVVVHPSSVVHSMVEFVDGSTLVQASPPDMRIPIALALGWPDRVPDAAPGCSWTEPATWEFYPLDDEAFPAVRLAREAGGAGGTAPAVYNAANEVAVEAFLAGRLPFVAVVDVVAEVLGEHTVGNVASLVDVEQADAWARERAGAIVTRSGE